MECTEGVLEGWFRRLDIHVDNQQSGEAVFAASFSNNGCLDTELHGSGGERKEKVCTDVCEASDLADIREKEK